MSDEAQEINEKLVEYNMIVNALDDTFSIMTLAQMEKIREIVFNYLSLIGD